ncbi:MAG: IS5 family transposase [Halieaceae bacterium]|jgi:IS5 family transposase
MTYRTFARLPNHVTPSRSGLQSTIRSIKPETLEKAHEVLSGNCLKKDVLSMDELRIDSTVVASNIAPPRDSQLLNDSARVLSRLLAKCKNVTRVKTRFTDQRKPSKSLAFQIFNAKNARKESLYPNLLKLYRVVVKQVASGLESVKADTFDAEKKGTWIHQAEHYRDLMLNVIDQTERRVIRKESVHSLKIVILFELHTDIIVKKFRDAQYAQKINLSSETNGFIT